jgi:UDP-GlcNAc3NAcA epimerase
MKIVTVIGARPQFIKASMLSRSLALRQGIEEIIVHTGQHYDPSMSEIFFEELQIPLPKHRLNVGGRTHGAMTGQMMESLEEVLIEEGPDTVLVYGDTNSTLAGALAAAKLHIPVAHVEAGLRSFNRRMPEEINRILTDHCSSLLFTPTKTATDQLIKEGFPNERVHMVGDIMYDCVLGFPLKTSILQQYGIHPKNYALATLHRSENTDDFDRLSNYIYGLIEVAKDIPVIMPLHPRTEKALQKYRLLGEVKAALIVLPPLGYLDMIALESQARVILTDSGGIQKEAYFFKVPCLTLRSETEWVELIEAGVSRLVPPASNEVIEAYRGVKGVEWVDGLYGDGKTAEKIVRVLECLG